MKIAIADFLRQCEAIQYGEWDHLNHGSLLIIEDRLIKAAAQAGKARHAAFLRNSPIVIRKSKMGKGAKG